MNSKELFNPREGENVVELSWPFYRFNAVIPNQIGGDIFVWLYLSLIVFFNEAKKSDKHNYNDDVKNEAKNLINDKFSNIIDKQTLIKIIDNAERDFINDGKIKNETFSFLDTYENLFSESCENRIVFQDAITGEVLPYFGDSSFAENLSKDNLSKGVKLYHNNLEEPSGRAIKKAYDQYIKLKKFNAVEREAEAEPDDEFFDEDEQTYLTDADDLIFETDSKKEIESLKKMDVIIINDSKELLYILVPVYIKDNQLSLRSPFNKMTDGWFNKCLLKGRNISEKNDNILKAIENQYCIEERKITSYIENHRKDFASSLKYCQSIYRLIDTLNDDKMRQYVVQLDARFCEGDIMCYLYIGKILDGILKRISYSEKTTAEERRSTSFKIFCDELDNKFKFSSIEYNFLKSKNIFGNWKKKKDDSEYISFKADLTDIILRTNIINSRYIYNSFIDEAFNLYSLRNAVAHNDDNVNVDKEELNKFFKVLIVLFELI